MRIILSWAALIMAACAVVGCGKEAATGLATDSASSGNLKATMTADAQFVHPGQNLHVTLKARNGGLYSMEITARSGALVLVTLWRYDAVKGWQRTGQYPQAATFQLTPWKLGPFAERTFQLTVPVDDTWPTNEWIRLSAELNGRPDVRPYVLVKVLGEQ